MTEDTRTRTWASEPMTAFALATTHWDPAQARIVAIATHTVNSDNNNAEVTVVNTPADIPVDATNIHGYDKAKTSNGYSPMSAVTVLVAQLADAAHAERPVVIFNASWFFQILSAEARHAGVAFTLPEGLRIIDPMIIDRHINPTRVTGKRTLNAVAQSWNVPITDPGSPEGNATNALRLAWRIGTAHRRIGQMDTATLHAAQAQWKREDDQSRAAHAA